MADPTTQTPKTPADEAAQSRAAAAKTAKDKKTALDKVAADRAAGKGPKVYANVNMMAKDGTHLVVGQETHLSQAEYDRLKSEARFEKKPCFYDSGSDAAKEAAVRAKFLAGQKPKPKQAAAKK